MGNILINILIDMDIFNYFCIVEFFCDFLIVSRSKLISRPYLPHAASALIKLRDKISLRKQLYCGNNSEKVFVKKIFEFEN